MGVEQRVGQSVDQNFEARGPRRVRHPELVAHGREQLEGGELRIEDHRDVDFGGKLLQEGAADGGLSGPHLARQLHEAPALAEAVEEMGKGLAVRFAQIEVARIRGQRKGPLGQPEVCRVHRWSASTSRDRYCPFRRTSS